MTTTTLNLYSIIPSDGRLLKLTKASHAFLYFKNKKINLLTGVVYRYDVMNWFQCLEIELEELKTPKRFIHFFYEFGELTEGQLENLDEETPLAIDIQYTKVFPVELKKINKSFNLKLTESISFADYQKAFDEGMNELKQGNCYQFNLTSAFRYRFAKEITPEDFIHAVWEKPEARGAYASATYSECLNWLFLSNSPECLFHYEDKRILTRPIKGTIALNSQSKIEIQNKWKKLIGDKKNEAELFMIADLLRNDLSRIDLPNARVVKKKAMLLVPGLMHQYSEIEATLSGKVTLKRVVEKLFPGGSVTGAPKKNVFKLLKKLEHSSRFFYCGSSLLFLERKIMASINIRSAFINFNENSLSYNSGGGITIKSKASLEFQEMLDKRDSFLKLLNSQNYSISNKNLHFD